MTKKEILINPAQKPPNEIEINNKKFQLVPSGKWYNPLDDEGKEICGNQIHIIFDEKIYKGVLEFEGTKIKIKSTEEPITNDIQDKLNEISEWEKLHNQIEEQHEKAYKIIDEKLNEIAKQQEELEKNDRRQRTKWRALYASIEKKQEELDKKEYRVNEINDEYKNKIKKEYTNKIDHLKQQLSITTTELKTYKNQNSKLLEIIKFGKEKEAEKPKNITEQIKRIISSNENGKTKDEILGELHMAGYPIEPHTLQKILFQLKESKQIDFINPNYIIKKDSL